MAGFFRLIAYSVPSMIVANASGALVSVCMCQILHTSECVILPILSCPTARVHARHSHSF
jgi:hypothetical protein